MLETLQTCAIIIRKYNLGGKEYFLQYFPKYDQTIQEAAWEYGLKEIQSREIIKDTQNLETNFHKIAVQKFVKFDNNQKVILAYLNSGFNVSLLKLNEEKVERRFRHLLAEYYIRREAYPNAKNYLTNNKSKIYFSRPYHYIILIIGIGLLLATPRIIDGFTHVDILANRIHNRSMRKSSGAICNDGWKSSSQGRGTCSHHRGVKYYFYKGDYTKTM